MTRASPAKWATWPGAPRPTTCPRRRGSPAGQVLEVALEPLHRRVAGATVLSRSKSLAPPHRVDLQQPVGYRDLRRGHPGGDTREHLTKKRARWPRDLPRGCGPARATMFCKRMAAISGPGSGWSSCARRPGPSPSGCWTPSVRCWPGFGRPRGSRPASRTAGWPRRRGGVRPRRPAVLGALGQASGVAALSAAHETVTAHHGNNYLPLVERFCRSSRPALFGRWMCWCSGWPAPTRACWTRSGS